MTTGVPAASTPPGDTIVAKSAKAPSALQTFRASALIGSYTVKVPLSDVQNACTAPQSVSTRALPERPPSPADSRSELPASRPRYSNPLIVDELPPSEAAENAHRHRNGVSFVRCV